MKSFENCLFVGGGLIGRCCRVTFLLICIIARQGLTVLAVDADEVVRIFFACLLYLFCLYPRGRLLEYRPKPAFAAMHGPHSLVRIGPGCADRA